MVGNPTHPARVREGRYELLDRLGEGGMGAVWRARDTALGVDRALKLLTGPVASRSTQRRRLRVEARAMARIQHPNVLRILDIGSEDELDWVVTELAAGGSLQDRIDATGPLPATDAVQFVIQVLSALAAAHAVGVVHRDVKPANILVDHEGRALLADFGIALLADDAELDRRTRVGIAMGSMAFMPPEQRVDARSVGPAADIYAAGATLYHLLSAANPVDLYAAPLDSPRWSGIHPELIGVLRRATALDPIERWPDAASMARALAAVLDHVGADALHVTFHTAVPAGPRQRGPAAAATRTALDALDQPEAFIRAPLAADDPFARTPPPAETRLEALTPPAPPPRWPLAVGAVGLVAVAIWALAPLWWRGEAPAPEPPRPAVVAAEPRPAPLPAPAPVPAPVPVPPSEPATAAPEAASPPRPALTPARPTPSKRPAAAEALAGLPAPFGLWRGSAGGIVAELRLEGTPEAVRGTWESRFGGKVQTSDLRGAYDSGARSLRLADTHDGTDAGVYHLTLTPDDSRLEGRFERDQGGVRTLSLRRP